MTTPPGWYPDPSRLWEVRWYDGATWSDQVATGGCPGTEAVQPIVTPPANPATVLWFATGKSENEPVRVDLTWQAVAFVPLRRVHETRHLPLGFVGVGVEAQAADGSGSLRLYVRGPGYVGPSTFLVRGIDNVAWGRAMILRQRAIATGVPAG